MSVFTLLERAELEAFIAPYGLGRLLDFQGIAAGTENSNFFVSLEAGEYVLTLVERGQRADLPFVVELLQRLHATGLPVPYGVATRSGECLRELADKPALLQPRLAGKHIEQPNAHHCAEVGSWLARMHLCTQAQPLERRSDRGLDWMLSEGSLQALQLDGEALELLRASLAEVTQAQAAVLALPRRHHPQRLVFNRQRQPRPQPRPRAAGGLRQPAALPSGRSRTVAVHAAHRLPALLAVTPDRRAPANGAGRAGQRPGRVSPAPAAASAGPPAVAAGALITTLQDIPPSCRPDFPATARSLARSTAQYCPGHPARPAS